MDECDLEPEQAGSRLAVDELGSGGGELGNGVADVLDLVGDVVHPRPALGEEPADSRVIARRGEQLDPGGADEERRGLDALVGHARPMLDPGGEEPLVRRDRLVEVADGDAEVMDAARGHAGDATDLPWGPARAARRR
jgi:hypothetical protein